MDNEFDIAELIEKTIRKVDGKYCVFSKKSGKNLGCSPSRKGAIKRLGQVEFFKRQHKSLTEDGIVAALEDGSLSVSDEEMFTFLGGAFKSIVSEDTKEDTQNCSLVEDAKRNYLYHKSLFAEVKHLSGQHDQQKHSGEQAGDASKLIVKDVSNELDRVAKEFRETKGEQSWLDIQGSDDVLTESGLADVVKIFAKTLGANISDTTASDIAGNLDGIEKWTSMLKHDWKGTFDYPESWTWRTDINDDELTASLESQLLDYVEEKSTTTERAIEGEQKHFSSDPTQSNNHRKLPMRDIIGREIDKKVLEVKDKWRSTEDAARDAMRAEEDYEKFLDRANKKWSELEYADLVKLISRIEDGVTFGDDEHMDNDTTASSSKEKEFNADVRKGYGLKLFAEKVGIASDLIPVEVAGVEKIKEKPRVEHLEEFEESVGKHLARQHDQKTHAGMKGVAGKVSHTPAQLREAAARQHAKDAGMTISEARKKVGTGIKVPTAKVKMANVPSYSAKEGVFITSSGKTIDVNDAAAKLQSFAVEGLMSVGHSEKEIFGDPGMIIDTVGDFVDTYLSGEAFANKGLGKDKNSSEYRRFVGDVVATVEQQLSKESGEGQDLETYYNTLDEKSDIVTIVSEVIKSTQK